MDEEMSLSSDTEVEERSGHSETADSTHVGRSPVNPHEVPTTSEQVHGEITLSVLSEPIIRFPTQEPPMDVKYWSVSRVPAHVREVEKEAYTPKIVSIGPFHHNEPSLRAFEDQKMRFLSRLQNQFSVEVLENAMREIEENTRKCYSESFQGIKSEDFVRIMLLDGCFIVELLRLYNNTTYQENLDVDEPILETRWMVPNIGRDLLMLENQLPMFVLHKIFHITTPVESEETYPLNMLALRFFEPLRPAKDKLEINRLNAEVEYPHLLALFQSTFMTPENLLPQWGNQSIYGKLPGKGWVHNATTLRYAGVRFKKKSGNFLDIEYKNTVLTIPTLYIDDGTSTLLRNLIAYEQSNRSANPYFSCLAVFLDCLVDTANDIKILHRAGIIKQLKGSDQEVVNLFNCLTKGVEIEMNDCYIIKQIQDINRRCRSKQARLCRSLFASNNKNIFRCFYSK